MLPSANVKTLAGRAGRLAIICGTSASAYKLHVWDWDTQKSQTFPLRGEDHSGIIIDRRKRITIFSQTETSNHEEVCTIC